MEPIVYSSVNKAIKALLISHGTLMDYIANQYIFQNNRPSIRRSVIIWTYFTTPPPDDSSGEENLAAFSDKPVGDNQARKEIIVFNEDNEPVYEFKSGIEMARYFGIYQNFTLVAKSVSYRQEILVLIVRH